MVVAGNEETGVSGIFPVTGISQRQATDMLWLTLERGDGSTSRMTFRGFRPWNVRSIGQRQCSDMVVLAHRRAPNHHFGGMIGGMAR